MSLSRAFLLSLATAMLLVPSDASAQLSQREGAQAFALDPQVVGSAAEQLSPRSAREELLAPSSAPLAHELESVRAFMPVQQARTRNRAGVPLMVGGGVLFVAGAIIGGDGGTILMIGGAGVGAYGAYTYFGG